MKGIIIDLETARKLEELEKLKNKIIIKVNKWVLEVIGVSLIKKLVNT